MAKKTKVKVKDVEVNETEFVESDHKVLNKIKIAVYIIIAILLLNTVLLVSYMNDDEASAIPADAEIYEEYDVSLFEEITAEEFVKLFKAPELSVVYMGREDCGYCLQFTPLLKQSVEEYDYKLHYIDVNKVTYDSEDAKLIQKLDSFLEENFGTTPMLVFIQDGKVLEHQLGAADYETVETLLQNYKIDKIN